MRHAAVWRIQFHNGDGWYESVQNSGPAGPAVGDLDTWQVLENEYVALFPAKFKSDGATLTWAELADYPLIMPPLIAS